MENKKIKILVIDDLQDNLITLNALIKDAFPEAITLNAQSGKAGLDLAAKEMPEVIIQDILMPGMDGYEVCQKLKADKNLCDIPVVFVTAIENNKAALVKALESGGEAFLTKPIDEIELTAQIRSMLKIKKANDAKKDEKVRLEKLVEERNKELVQELEARKQAEEELRESKLQLESAIKASNTGLWDWDLTNNKVYFSSEWKKQIGYEDHEISSDFSEWQNHAHPDDLKKALSRVNAFLEKPYPNFENEFRFRHKNGSYRWILAKASIIYDEHGKPIRMLGSHLDITERKQAEVKLKESEERYRSLVNTVNSGVAIYKVMNEGLSGSDYIIQDFNQFALKHEMLNKEEVIGKSLKDIRPNIDEYGLIDIFRKVWETGESTYFPAKVYIDEKYSNYYENRVFKLPSGEIVAVYDDVTERERAELALIESEERFNLAMNASNDGLFDWNLLTNKIYYSPAWKKMIGYEDHEIPNDFSVWETTTALEDVKKSWELQQKLILKQIDRFMIEFKMKHKDGHWVDILSRAKAIFDEKGKAIRIVGTHTDISERRKAEEEIRKIGKHYQALIEKAPDGIVLLNAEGKFKYVSPSARKRFGYSQTEIIPDDPSEYTHPDDLMMVLSELEKVFADPDYIPTLVYRFIDKKGNWHWVETTFSNLLANPSVESIVLNFRDITERKQAEQQQQIMAEMLDIAPGSITVHDTNGRFLFANKKTFELHGYSKSEFMSLNLHDLDVPESAALLNERFRKIAETGYASFEVAHFHKDGHIIPMEVFAKCVEWKGLPAILSIATDITERVKNEADLRVSLTKYQVLFDLFPVGITLTDSIGQITETNKIAEKLLGISREEHVRRTISGVEWRIIRPDGSSMPVSEYASVRAIKEGCPVHNIEMGIVKDKNAITWLNVSAEPIPLEGYGVAIIYNDITRQKQVERDLIEAKNRAEENEKKYQSMFNTMQEGVYLHEIIYDDNGKPNNYRIIEANPVSEKYLNIERENAIGKLATELFGVQTAPNLDIYARVAETGEPVLFEQYFEPMNKYFFVSVFSPKRGEFATAFMDITRQKNYENEILAAKEKAEESDRLKSAFLANMSHEIRTPMNGILGFAELLKEPNLSGDEHKKYIQIIEKSGARMLNTINAIVDISKIEAGLMEVVTVEVNINEIMNFVFNFFQSEADSKGIVLILRNNLTAEQAIIKTDKEKLNAILFNLVKNAIKYTKKGVILFGCSIKPHKNENGLVDKNEVEFFVKDTGIGIPADRQKAVFERFIQADVIDKNAYQGSGLGLSISKAYVEMLGGRIWLKSVVGTGTTFYFTIPSGPHQEYSGISDQISKENYGTDPKNTDKLSLKILVVEDHAPSALYLSQIIKTVSKETLLAESGTKAIELCRNNPDLDLVLMDIRMPEMDGYEATRQIRLFNKEILIIVQTAHALAEYRDKSLRAGADAHISKPVNKDELLKLIRSQIRKKEAKG